jgi:hypothetical protein
MLTWPQNDCQLTADVGLSQHVNEQSVVASQRDMPLVLLLTGLCKRRSLNGSCKPILQANLAQDCNISSITAGRGSWHTVSCLSQPNIHSSIPRTVLGPDARCLFAFQLKVHSTKCVAVASKQMYCRFAVLDDPCEHAITNKIADAVIYARDDLWLLPCLVLLFCYITGCHWVPAKQGLLLLLRSCCLPTAAGFLAGCGDY